MSTTNFLLSYSDSRAGRIAVLTMDNGSRVPDIKPNAFGEAPLASLNAALDELEGQDDVKGLMLTGMPFMFAAGADITTFAGAGAELARVGGEGGHATFKRISALPYPTLAAINGVALGGGLEIALHCDYRSLSTGAMMVAFPEVFLGILPAWGGTQLATRLVGARKAVEVIVQNAMNNNVMLKPKQAFDAGFADRFIDSASFHDDSMDLLIRLLLGEETIQRTAPVQDDLDQVFVDARAFADAKVHGATRAPYLAIDCIEHAARGGDLDEGRTKEIEALVELLPSDQCQASIYAFELTQARVKKQPGKPAGVRGRQVKKVAVIGSGLMGAQLGSLFLQRYETTLVMKDINADVLVKAREHIEADLDKRVQRGRLKAGKAAHLKALVTYTTSYDDVAGTDFAIEAVLERMDLKQMIFADLEKVLEPGAVLATNTSSLSIKQMGSKLANPERVVGFHFFNPVAILPLVEVIGWDGISDEALATAYDVAKKLRKSAVGCQDAPAFIVNRLLTRFNAAAVAGLGHGNGFKEIDEAIKGLGLPMGPFELFGLVGLQVAYHTGESLAEAFPERFAIDENFRVIGESDKPGIYDWANGAEPYAEFTEAIVIADGVEKLTADQIRMAALEATADEIRHMLDEGVVADARDIDTAMIFGAGFPFFLGGIAKHLDQRGVSQKITGGNLLGAVDQGLPA
ncbi:MAG: 3-hydroxyacyl-CoA dehydrogenase/enoyl-CoA hydratase/carnithine racemase [Glaciecola sp.]|jgi:3-hydroxyacyl-CoA dehydrogenase/enoyl-CoA hydratase/carnithine racemase